MNLSDFQTFYKQAWTYCRPRLRNLTHSQVEMEDAFSEAIARFWIAFQQGKIKHEENLFAMVYVMAKNHWLGELRQQKKQWVVSMDDADSHIQISDENADILQNLFSENEQNQQTEILEKAWKKLDEKCQQMLNATIVYRERQDELLTKMGYKNTDTIKATKYRCLQYLKKFYYEIK